MRTLTHVKATDRPRLLRLLDPVLVEPGRVVLPAGVRVDHLYVVGTGLVSTTDADGTMRLHAAGEPIGLKEMLDGRPLASAMVAVTESEIWTMRRRDFVGACLDVPGFALGLLEGQIRGLDAHTA